MLEFFGCFTIFGAGFWLGVVSMGWAISGAIKTPSEFPNVAAKLAKAYAESGKKAPE